MLIFLSTYIYIYLINVKRDMNLNSTARGMWDGLEEQSGKYCDYSTIATNTRNN